MSDTLQLVIDNQLRNELDETKHVNRLSKGGYDERVPSSVSFVHDYMSAQVHVSDREGQREKRGDVREYTVYPAKTGIAP